MSETTLQKVEAEVQKLTAELESLERAQVRRACACGTAVCAKGFLRPGGGGGGGILYFAGGQACADCSVCERGFLRPGGVGCRTLRAATRAAAQKSHARWAVEPQPTGLGFGIVSGCRVAKKGHPEGGEGPKAETRPCVARLVSRSLFLTYIFKRQRCGVTCYLACRVSP